MTVLSPKQLAYTPGEQDTQGPVNNRAIASVPASADGWPKRQNSTKVLFEKKH